MTTETKTTFTFTLQLGHFKADYLLFETTAPVDFGRSYELGPDGGIVYELE